MSEPQIDPLIGYQEIHSLYVPSVPVGTLRALHSNGRMPPSIVIGRRRLWRASAVEQWIRNLEAASTPETAAS